MKDRMKLFVAGGVIVGVLLAGIGVAVAVSGDDGDDQQLTGSELDQASAAALAEVGEGRVTGSEADDEEGAYEIEVTRDDGTQVDVHLDSGFTVIRTDEDGVEDSSDDGPGDDDGDDRHDDDRDGDDRDGNDPDDAPISEQERTQAAEAAVAEAGGGTATDVDREDDGGTLGWEVEVTLDDGRQVEVRLDADFAVVSASQPHADD